MDTNSSLIQKIIDQTPDWRKKTFITLRKIIHSADPKIIEEVKWRRPGNPLGAPVWEHNGFVCTGNILKESVRLTFVLGTKLPDPKKLFNSRLDSRTVRAIDFYKDTKINEAAVKALIKASVKYNLEKEKTKQKLKK
jgi:hypothetical protein